MGKTQTNMTIDDLLRQNEELSIRLHEAEEALEAIRNGEVDAIIVSGQTGEKVFSLSSAETPYRIILEEMSDGAVILKADGTILYCNERFNYFIGKSPVLGLNILDLVSENEKSKLMKLLYDGFNERAACMISLSGPQNNILYLNFSARRLPSIVDGDICMIISDLTKIQEYQNHLHELVKERTQEIEKANEQLQELIATKNKFFSIIAHDLSSPFTGLIGVSEFLSENYESMDKEEIKTMVTILKDSSQNAYYLLQNLLNWSRSQTGSLKICPGKIDLRQLVDEEIHIAFQASTNKEIQIVSKVNDNFIIYTDRNILNTILRNLINNAIKFTPRKGLVLINSSQDGHNYLISVKDTGIGISKENLKNIFNLETASSRLGTESEKGTGLGLKLCKEFVEKLNGKIWADSSVLTGSEFIVSIPVNAQMTSTGE